MTASCTTQSPARDTAEPSASPDDRLHPIKVVSFNIRYPNRNDGPDYWGNRKHRVVQTLERLAPDVFGIQEAYDHQAQYLLDEMPGYVMIGVGRDDGQHAGEMTAIFYHTQRLALLDYGHLWLSDTPDVPGSVGWDASMTRMATWLVLGDRWTGQTWLVVNTHFDHRGAVARVESAKLLGRFIQAKCDELGPEASAVLMGDFNSAVDSAPYAALCEDPDGPALRDTFVVARQRDAAAAGEGTFNGFRGRTDSARIDWVLATPGVVVEQAGIDRVQVEGRNPSDHDPVWAVLRRE
ncbi:MAG: endonuclease/exonuclease/phosphatase family protein [Planctomycetota bacterium]